MIVKSITFQNPEITSGKKEKETNSEKHPTERRRKLIQQLALSGNLIRVLSLNTTIRYTEIVCDNIHNKTTTVD